MKTVPLRRAASFYSGGTPSKSNPLYWGGTIPWISGKDLKKFYLDDSIERITEEGAQTVRLASPDSILVLVRGMMLNRALPLGILQVPATFNQDVKALVASESYDSIFLAYYLASQESRILGLVTRSSHGTGKLETDELASYPIPDLDLPTQRRIAAILQTWDRAIALAERQLQLLRDRKRGLMQLLLTGEKRLPGFEGAWEEGALSDLGQVLKGTGLKKEDMQEVGVQCIRYAELYTSYGSHIMEVKSHTSEAIAKSRLLLQSGDILLPSSGEDRVDIGSAAAYLGNATCVVGGDMLVIRPVSALSRFLGYSLNQEAVRRQFYAVAQGVSVVHVYKSNLNEITVLLPEEREQLAISAVLDTASTAVNEMQTWICRLRAQKKGLMQHLLDDPQPLGPEFDKFVEAEASPPART